MGLVWDHHGLGEKLHQPQQPRPGLIFSLKSGTRWGFVLRAARPSPPLEIVAFLPLRHPPCPLGDSPGRVPSQNSTVGTSRVSPNPQGWSWECHE